MRVLCCYTALHPLAAAALAEHAPDAELAGVSGDPYGYGRQITARWDGSSDLAVIEHDVEITAGVVPGFAACPGDWCVHPYEVAHRGNWAGVVAQGLGCVKFSGRVQRAVPAGALLGPFPNNCGCDGPGCWHNLDKVVTAAVAGAGFRPCVHLPGLRHLRPELYPEVAA